MKRSAFLTALYVSFLSFSLLTLFFGKTGVTSLDKLRIRNLALSSNLSDLGAKQVNLTAKLDSLRSDPESIVIEARALGLYRVGDKVVRFRNLQSLHTLPDAGQVLHLLPLQRTDESLIRVFSLASGIIFLLLSLIIWKVKDASVTR
jgi:cell division protein FtsB